MLRHRVRECGWCLPAHTVCGWEPEPTTRDSRLTPRAVDSWQNATHCVQSRRYLRSRTVAWWRPFHLHISLLDIIHRITTFVLKYSPPKRTSLHLHFLPTAKRPRYCSQKSWTVRGPLQNCPIAVRHSQYINTSNIPAKPAPNPTRTSIKTLPSLPFANTGPKKTLLQPSPFPKIKCETITP